MIIFGNCNFRLILIFNSMTYTMYFLTSVGSDQQARICGRALKVSGPGHIEPTTHHSIFGPARNAKLAWSTFLPNKIIACNTQTAVPLGGPLDGGRGPARDLHGVDQHAGEPERDALRELVPVHRDLRSRRVGDLRRRTRRVATPFRLCSFTLTRVHGAFQRRAKKKKHSGGLPRSSRRSRCGPPCR